MYEKNNLNSLLRLNKDINVLAKSRLSPRTMNKPLTNIENSLQKLKKKKSRSKSKSKSKENTPQKEKSKQKRDSIKDRLNNIYLHKFEQKSLEPQDKPIIRKVNSHFTEHINSVVTSYNSQIVKKSSDIYPLDKKLRQSNTNSCVDSQYQFSLNSNISQKSVKFSDKIIQTNNLRLNPRQKTQIQGERIKTPSILKKNNSFASLNSQRSNSNRSSRGSSMRSSSKLTRTKQLNQMQSLNLNKISKSKYENIVKKFNNLNRPYGRNPKNYLKLQKYTDDIFPPYSTSIFSYSIHKKTQKPKNIEWKRIPELFPSQNLIVLRQQNMKSTIKIVKKLKSIAQQYFVTAMNCIRQNKKLLQKMFQFYEVNQCGVYLVKIYQERSWKYVIIDDLIPVIYDQTNQKYQPLFINIQKAQGNTNDTIEIWPFLLQKAFASYYSKYEALKYGCQLNILQELVGVPSQKINVKKMQLDQKYASNLQNLLREEKVIILGEKIDQKSSFYCIFPDLNSITKRSQGFCTNVCSQTNYKPARQKIQTFINSLTNLYILQLNLPQNSTLSFLCPQNKKPLNQGSIRYTKKSSFTDSINYDNNRPNDIHLKFFTINETTNCILTLKQKDQKFYFQAKAQYKYIWIRVILLLKEHNEDYRWIKGLYSNEKTLSLFSKLQPGEYYLLLMPEWQSAHKYDIAISFYTDSFPVALEKKTYDPTEQIFQKGCADIAQREGIMNQINKYICSYNYVSQQIGLVIENINNQRQNGPVTVMRSISGLKCQVDIVPVNKQFYYTVNSDYEMQVGKKMKKTIEVDIQANQHYTVVLKTMGGVDHKFFQSFDFGC